MIHILSFDYDKYGMDEIGHIFHVVKEALPEGDTVIAIPKNINLYLDVPIETLYYYRQLFDDVIQERLRSNMLKNDL